MKTHTIKFTTFQLRLHKDGLLYAMDYQGNPEAEAPYKKELERIKKLTSKAKPGPALRKRKQSEPLQDPAVQARLRQVKPGQDPVAKALARYPAPTQSPALGDYTPPYDFAAPTAEELSRPHIGYICFACSSKLKAVWPKGHCATCHMGVCPECNTRQSLASVDDWDWPKGSKRPKHGAGRD